MLGRATDTIPRPLTVDQLARSLVDLAAQPADMGLDDIVRGSK